MNKLMFERKFDTSILDQRQYMLKYQTYIREQEYRDFVLYGGGVNMDDSNNSYVVDDYAQDYFE